MKINIAKNESKKIFFLDLNKVLASSSKDKVVLNAVFSSENKILAERNIYFTKPKDLQLLKPKIAISTTKTDTGYIIELKADKLVKNIQLIPNIEGRLSDNYFDILPNRKYHITFETVSPKQLKINYRSLNTFIK